MDDAKNMVPEENATAVDPERRNLAMTLVGALCGSAFLQACATDGEATTASEEIGRASEMLSGATSVRWCDTMVEQQAVKGGTTGSSVNVCIRRGYGSPADGGGGVFVWTTDVTTPQSSDPLGGILVVPSGARTGCWKRLFSGALDVRWFGAKCDGTTNDLGALNAAVNALYSISPSGGTILIPGFMAVGSAGWAGVTVSSRNNLTLLGVGRNAGFKVLVTPSQTVPIGGQPHVVAFLFVSCDGLQIRSLSFDGNVKNTGLVGFASVTNSQVVDCYIHDTGPIAVAGRFPIGITSYNGANNTYAQNRLFNCCFGLYLGLCDVGLHETDALITRNTIMTDSPTSCVDALTTAAFDSIISENIIDGNQGGLIINSNSTTQNPALAPNGLTIESNVIRNNLGAGLQADRSGPNPVHDWVIRGNVFENNGRPALFMSGTVNMSVVGNTFRNNNQLVIDHGHVYLDSGHSLIIDGNLFIDDQASHTSRVALYLTPGALNDMSDVILSNNVVDGTGVGGIGEGIRLYATANAVVTGNVVKNHLVAGIRLGLGSTNVTVANNSFRSNGVDVLQDAPVTDLVATVATNRVAFGASQPTSGTWKQGDILWNTSASGGGKVGWVCIAAGTPGTWKAFGAIDT